jgi:hypothetical protein
MQHSRRNRRPHRGVALISSSFYLYGELDTDRIVSERLAW